MDDILGISVLFPVFALVVLGADVPSKSFSNGSQFVFDGSSSGYIITAGGDTPTGAITNAYSLDLNNGIWSELAWLPQYMYNFNLVLRDSTVYAVGGWTGSNSKTTLILSNKDSMWKDGSDLIFDYGTVLSASVNGLIYAVGGSMNGKTLQAMGCNGAWNRLAPSNYKHTSQYDGITVLNDKIYVLGCHHQDEVYDPSTNIWTAIKMTNQDRCYARIVALNGYIYVIGGANAKNERYDPKTGDLTYFDECIFTPVYWHGVATDGEKIYVIGGQLDGTDINKVQVYRPELDLWQSMSEFPTAVNALGVVYVKEQPTD